MKQFLKYVLATIVGLILSFLIVILIFTAIIGIATKDKTKPVAANSVLQLDLSYPIPEKTSENPFESFDFQSFEAKKHLGLNDIIFSINAAAEDDDIKGIYIELSDVGAGYTTIKSIRDQLIKFKESGKFVIAYGEYVSQKAYYLGSVSDEVYLNPQGYVDFRGLGAQMLFLKGTLDKLEIDMEVFKTGDYKSAAETFTHKELSEDNRQQIEEYIKDVYDVMLEDIAASRNTTSSGLHEIADGMLAKMPSSAENRGIVDKTWYFDQVLTRLKERAGVGEDEKLPSVSLPDYYSTTSKAGGIGKDKIAVIFASGTIVDGEGEEQEVDSKRYAKLIRKLRDDENIKGIVMRVNSPGGSAMASEVIWRELKLTQEKKPVVVSMGEVAASGGYYISCNADKIFAEPTTITGSIGVIGAIPIFEDFFNDKLGVTFDEIEMAQYSIFGGVTKQFTDNEKDIIQEGIDTVYHVFKTRVSKGRELSMETVHALAGGRIYSGLDALEADLVDELGGLNAAVAEVAEMAGIEDYKTIDYPKAKNPLEQFLSTVSRDASVQNIIKEEMGDYYYMYNTLSTMKNWNPVQARLWFDIKLK